MEKKGRFSYTESQKEINRAFKMQENELRDLHRKSDNFSGKIENNREKISSATLKIEDLKKRVEALTNKATKLANETGIHVQQPKSSVKSIKTPPRFKKPYMADEKIDSENIPSWDEVMIKTNKSIPEEVILEDLLTRAEFQYCLDDVKRINDEFAVKTKLSKVDISFLMIATALQTARWILIQHFLGELGDTIDQNERMNSKDGDKIKKKATNKFNAGQDNRENKISKKGYPTWKDIIFGQYEKDDGTGKSSWNCPYDAQSNPPAGFDEDGKGSHRANTLGHDPILGWIFGTANLMTCTISLSKKFNFDTYRVHYPYGRFGERVAMSQMFYEVYESIMEDKYRLPAGLFAQAMHLKSDEYTSKGLPVPLLEVFTKDFAGKLYSEQYDALCLARDVKLVGIQAVLSILINMIINLSHSLFYNPQKDGIREHYEVRTRKILLYSNAISSSINLAYVGVNAYIGNETEALKKLDLGGLLVTLWRLFSDVRFITKVKDDFIKSEFDKVTADSIKELDSMFK